jgi:hypothetical protein
MKGSIRPEIDREDIVRKTQIWSRRNLIILVFFLSQLNYNLVLVLFLILTRDETFRSKNEFCKSFNTMATAQLKSAEVEAATIISTAREG